MKLGPRKYYKEITFDLDTTKLQDYYDDYTKAYRDIRRFMEQNGFTHRQGSVYNSVEKLSELKITALCYKLKDTFKWSADCIKALDVANIGHQHSLLDIFCDNSHSRDFSMEEDQISNYMEQDDDFDMEI